LVSFGIWQRERGKGAAGSGLTYNALQGRICNGSRFEQSLQTTATIFATALRLFSYHGSYLRREKKAFCLVEDIVAHR
jgi:hypothetical protein